MRYLKRFLIGIIFVSSTLLPLTLYAFVIEERNVLCQSEQDTSTEESSEESTKESTKGSKGKPEEESNPEEECD